MTSLGAMATKLVTNVSPVNHWHSQLTSIAEFVENNETIC
jgi:hypothetical protein